jgi:hypothetical protein
VANKTVQTSTQNTSADPQPGSEGKIKIPPREESFGSRRRKDAADQRTVLFEGRLPKREGRLFEEDLKSDYAKDQFSLLSSISGV